MHRKISVTLLEEVDWFTLEKYVSKCVPTSMVCAVHTIAVLVIDFALACGSMMVMNLATTRKTVRENLVFYGSSLL